MNNSVWRYPVRMYWIKNRFSLLYSKEIGTISNSKNHNENTFSYTITDKSARFIYEYF